MTPRPLRSARCCALWLVLAAAMVGAAPADTARPDTETEGQIEDRTAGEAAEESEDESSAFGIRFDTDRPVSIRSDELESLRSNGARTLVFTRNVIVVQDDVTMRSDYLEAYYPPDEDEPSRMLANGNVRLSNGRYDARCDEVTYEREADRMLCRGNAELREDDDCIAGQWIEFDLEAETVKVGGGATVILGRDEPPSGAGGCG